MMEPSMSSAASLHGLVDKGNWHFKKIMEFLERDSSSINEINLDSKTPLLRILQQELCSEEIVKLLLKFGAEVNYMDEYGETPLIAALKFSRDESVIRVLVGKGADVNVIVSSHSTLCLALQYGASKGVIKLLLDAGSSPNTCRIHLSLFHCASFYPNSRLKQDIFQFLTEKGADLRAIHKEKEAPLCWPLQNGDEASTTELLLSIGASLNVCSKHASPLFCATEDVEKGTPLKTEVVEPLIQMGASVDKLNDMDRKPVEYALRNCKSGTEAIRLLLHNVNPDKFVDGLRSYLLHVAVSNTYYKLRIVKVPIRKVNNYKESPLHIALQNPVCKPSVLKTLLKKRAQVNEAYIYDDTPLRVAVQNWQDSTILKMLFDGGALISKTRFCGSPLLKVFLDQCNLASRRLVSFKMLLKYFFIETSCFDLEYMFRRSKHSEVLLRFRDECKIEVQEMQPNKVCDDLALHKFLRDCQLPKHNYDIDRLLNIIADNALPLYFSIISARVGRSPIEKKLQDVMIYAINFSTNKPHVMNAIILDYYSLLDIAQYLTGDDMLKLILAFYNMRDNSCTDEGHKEENIAGKRSAEITEQFRKRPKLH